MVDVFGHLQTLSHVLPSISSLPALHLGLDLAVPHCPQRDADQAPELPVRRYLGAFNAPCRMSQRNGPLPLEPLPCPPSNIQASSPYITQRIINVQYIPPIRIQPLRIPIQAPSFLIPLPHPILILLPLITEQIFQFLPAAAPAAVFGAWVALSMEVSTHAAKHVPELFSSPFASYRR